MKPVSGISLLLIFSGLLTNLSGQYIFNTITAEKGLPSNDVRCMIKDRDGFLWLGTSNGLCRFDGSEILVFQHNPIDNNSLCDNDIKIGRAHV